MFQSRFGKIDEFWRWYLEIISADAGTQFTSTEFKKECQTRGVHLTLVDPEHQEMNGQVGLTWITLRTIVHSIMVHARVLEAYIHFQFMFTVHRYQHTVRTSCTYNLKKDSTQTHRHSNHNCATERAHSKLSPAELDSTLLPTGIDSSTSACKSQSRGRARTRKVGFDPSSVRPHN